MHYLPMSFPCSNREVCEVFGDERDVCLCQGLKDCFEHIGGVPPVIVLDNATEAGRRWRDIVVESDLFRRLRLRYGFEPRFCNPNAGREKGNVEGKVGYTRRRFFVPVPTIGDLRDFNHALQDAIDSHSEEQVHYEKGLAWAELFEVDRSHLLPLPGKPFDVVKWESGKTDGYGRSTAATATSRPPSSPTPRSSWASVPSRWRSTRLTGPRSGPTRGALAWHSPPTRTRWPCSTCSR